MKPTVQQHGEYVKIDLKQCDLVLCTTEKAKELLQSMMEWYNKTSKDGSFCQFHPVDKGSPCPKEYPKNIEPMQESMGKPPSDYQKVLTPIPTEIRDLHPHGGLDIGLMDADPPV